MTEVLSCAGYGFSFSGEPALREISFALGKGEYLSILGPNGAGKSTLLKSFLRLHDTGREKGAIYIHGRSLASYSQRELARLIAYVPQAGARIPPFTVSGFVHLSRYPYLTDTRALQETDRREIAEALVMTGVLPFADRPLYALSGGERQRVYLAAALAQGAGILLLDEPTSFLDPRHASDVNALLKRLNHEHGLTILTVTHDLNHPLEAGGLAIVLRQGKQVYFGPAEVLAEGSVLTTAFDHTFTCFTHPKTGKTLIFSDQA